MFHYLGLLLVLISWVAGVYMVRKWRGTYAMTISEHAASARGATLLFAIILGGGSCLFYWWLITWLAPRLELTNAFVYLLCITALAQITVAIVPDTVGWRHHVHQKVALTMSVLYLPLTYMILASSQLSVAARIVSYFCVAYMVVAPIGFFLVKSSRRYYLIFQSLYIVAFQVIILSAAYLG